MFLFVEKLLGPRTAFKPPKVYFIESAGNGSHIEALRLNFITVLECCVINTLHFRFFQHKKGTALCSKEPVVSTLLSIILKYFMLTFGKHEILVQGGLNSGIILFMITLILPTLFSILHKYFMLPNNSVKALCREFKTAEA